MRTLLAQPDRCPVCPPGDFPACLPLSDPVEADGITYAPYEHQECGTEWLTRFDRYGWVISRDIAPVTPERAVRNLDTLKRVAGEGEAA